MKLPKMDPLGITRRESEVLLEISKGKTSFEISKLLKISKRTVDGHTASIFKKLGVKTRTAAAFRLYEIENKREDTNGMDQYH